MKKMLRKGKSGGGFVKILGVPATSIRFAHSSCRRATPGSAVASFLRSVRASPSLHSGTATPPCVSLTQVTENCSILC